MLYFICCLYRILSGSPAATSETANPVSGGRRSTCQERPHAAGKDGGLLGRRGSWVVAGVWPEFTCLEKLAGWVVLGQGAVSTYGRSGCVCVAQIWWPDEGAPPAEDSQMAMLSDAPGSPGAQCPPAQPAHGGTVRLGTRYPFPTQTFRISYSIYYKRYTVVQRLLSVEDTETQFLN